MNDSSGFSGFSVGFEAEGLILEKPMMGILSLMVG